MLQPLGINLLAMSARCRPICISPFLGKMTFTSRQQINGASDLYMTQVKESCMINLMGCQWFMSYASLNEDYLHSGDFIKSYSWLLPEYSRTKTETVTSFSPG